MLEFMPEKTYRHKRMRESDFRVSSIRRKGAYYILTGYWFTQDKRRQLNIVEDEIMVRVKAASDWILVR